MSLTLELSPAQESELRTAARREGMPVTDYAHQLFATALRQQTPVLSLQDASLDWEAELQWAQQQAREAFAVSGVTDDELTADVEAEVDDYRAEVYARTQAKSNPL